VRSRDGYLDYRPEVKKALEDVKPELNAYIKASDDHLKLAAEDKAAAKANYNTFLEAFESLEGKMGDLSDLINKNIEDAKNGQIEAVSKFHTILFTFTAVFIVILFVSTKPVGASSACEWSPGPDARLSQGMGVKTSINGVTMLPGSTRGATSIEQRSFGCHAGRKTACGHESPDPACDLIAGVNKSCSA
jgi:hypothetical protein